MTTMSTDKPATKLPRKMAREPKPQQVEALQGNAKGSRGNDETPVESTTTAASPAALCPTPTTKTATVLGLLTRAEGASLEQMVQATGWLPHTTRAALTGLKKKGHELTNIKADGVRTYRVTRVQPSEANQSEEVEGEREA